MVMSCKNAYPLPVGLVEGDVVRILAFNCGYYTVEKGGRTFSSFWRMFAGSAGMERTHSGSTFPRKT
jgi:hypothetical protein